MAKILTALPQAIRALVCACLTLVPHALPATAQGFAGMGSDADGFQLPAPGRAFSFPQDHGAHPGFRIEWWYVTANLEDAESRAFGAQWTLFRASLSPDPGEGWTSSQIWFAHAGLTDASRHFTAQRFARGGIGQAGVMAQPFHAWINDWAMIGRDNSAEALDNLQIQARGADFAYDLALAAEGPLVTHGEGGYSVKSPRGQASYYYSQPHYHVTGMLDLPEGPVAVTGTAWLDREWSSQPLAPSQTGWDWFSLHLEDDTKLMVYRLRDAEAADFVPGTHILPDGTAQHIPDGAITLTPEGTAQVAGREIPVRWRIQWPDKGYDLHTAPLNPQSWMDTNVPYWEGPVTVQGSHSGKGYLEMTGYE